MFLGLLVALSFFEPLILNTHFQDPQQRINATFISLGVTRLVIYPWQFVGLLRAVDKHFLTSSNTIQTRAIQAVLVLSVLFTLTYCVGIIQGAYSNKRTVQASNNIKPKQPLYTLSVIKEKQLLYIQGDFELGISKAVKDLVAKHQDINAVLLESDGGHIYEGRGLSLFFTKHNIDTYVEKYCYSACTTAFIGGKKRNLNKNAKLGFHQYKLDYSVQKRSVGFHKAEDEQKRDHALFKSRGVSSAFLDKIFLVSPEKMWFPSHEELTKANVIHQSME